MKKEIFYIYDYILVFTNRTTNKLTISGVQSAWTLQEIKEKVANLRAAYRENGRVDMSVKHLILRDRRVR